MSSAGLDAETLERLWDEAVEILEKNRVGEDEDEEIEAFLECTTECVYKAAAVHVERLREFIDAVERKTKGDEDDGNTRRDSKSSSEQG